MAMGARALLCRDVTASRVSAVVPATGALIDREKAYVHPSTTTVHTM